MTNRIILNFLLLLILASCSGTNEKKEETGPPFDFPEFKPPIFKDQVFDITQYGAKSGDTTFLNTNSIAKAIDECFRSGGGKVVVPQGIWFSGPIHLKSNVNLYIEEDAEIRFSQKFSDYLPVVLIQRGGVFCYNYSPPLYAKGCENIAVTGKGVLNGRGQVWWPWKDKQPGMTRLFEMGKEGVPVEERVFGTEEAGVRPPFIQFLECKNILMEGITVKDGPSWNFHPVFCENMIIRDVKILSPNGPNNDGIDIDACKNVLIEDCFIDAGDDAICLKALRDQEAWRYARPLENMIVRRCTTKNGHGGFVIGSEMSAGVRNVLVEDCDFDGTQRGLRFKSQACRGGVVENIWARNIRMNNIRDQAIHFDLLYYSKSTDEAPPDPPTFRNIHMENITCEKAKIAISITGLRGNYLRELYFKNINIKARTGLITSNINDISLENVNITSLKE